MAAGKATKSYYPFKLIQWELGQLQDFEQNPVQLKEREARKLAEQMRRGQDIPYVASAPPNGKTAALPLMDGHQRKKVELEINQVSTKKRVPVLVPSRRMTEREIKQWVIEHRKNTGEFDNDALLNWFEAGDLLDWGFAPYELSIAGFELENEVDYKKEWEGMPEFRQEDLSAVKQITVNFASMDDYQAFAKLIGQELTEKTRSVWYPEAEKLSQTDKIYQDES